MQTSPELAGFSPARLARIDAHLTERYIDPDKIAGCQVAVMRRGHLAHFSSLGRRDLGRDLAMTDDTIFRIYSMTKPITSIALMQLYEQGHFQLNDPVHRVIPSWRDHRVYISGEGEGMETRQPDRAMSFRDVLRHTAGLSYGATRHPVDKVYRALHVRRDQGETLETFVEKLSGVPLHYSPGEKWMYSYATDVCGHLVEVLSGKPLDVYFREHIFEPLGMVDTAFNLVPDKVDRFAANYQRKPDKSLELVDDPRESTYLAEPSFFSGGGGLIGTTADYLRFCEMLRCNGTLDGERIIGSRTLDLMTKNHLKDGSDLTSMAVGAFSETAYEGIGFGLGFAMTLSDVAAGTVGQGDYYWGGAASTIFWADPAEELVVVFMTQLMPSATFNFRGQLKSIIYGAIES